MKQTIRRGTAAILGVALIGLTSCAMIEKMNAPDLSLAVDGTTAYQIVKPAEPSLVDDYAIQELAGVLQQVTGVEFPVVAPGEMTPGKPSIFVGLSDPAMARLGNDPLSGLEDQEHVARSAGANIFLYGKGKHGNMYAVFNFLEHSLGWRWFTVFEHPVVPSKPTLTLEPFHREEAYSFAFRKVGIRRGLDFYYQNGINQAFSGRIHAVATRDGEDKVTHLMHFVSHTPEIGRGHSLHLYIPPNPSTVGTHGFEWMSRTNYFETNPEYFSMWENGKRVPDKQLCFSNPGLRRELTGNVLKHIGMFGEEVIVTLGANDHPGPFCYCDDCKVLEKKYESPGGPIYDYLIELCNLLAEQHPKVLVKSFGYRRSQTQEPPVLPEGVRMPDNLIIDFAPIEDSYFADWTHPDPGIQDTYNDLKAWGRVVKHLWCWLYPNPWGTGAFMPVGNVQRAVINMRLMKEAGVEGAFTDHNGHHQRSGFSELQQYLIMNLMKDVDSDTDRLIEEFTDSLYGPAAPLMRQYINELEAERKAMVDLVPGITYRSSNCDERTFPYLTAENINRWQALFDRMSAAVAGDSERVRNNVDIVRRELDFAALWKWFDLQTAYPETYTDPAVFAERIKTINKAGPQPPMNDADANRTDWEERTNKNMNRKASPLGEAFLADLVTLVQCGGKEKPLPAEFDGVDPAKIKTFVPKHSNRRRGKAIVPDKEAAFGYGVPVAIPDMPFEFGFYQNTTKTHGPRRKLDAAEIETGSYKLYKLGIVEITPECVLWFSAKSWSTNLGLGDRLYEPGAENLWEAYVSLKFDGPTYGGEVNEALLPLKDRNDYGDYRRGKTNQDLVLVDRIILVAKSKDQFEEP